MAYSSEELKAKATYTVAAQGTAKYKELIMRLVVKRGMLPATVEKNIRELANS